MALICPTITAADPHEYRTQMERVAPFAERIHIDLADGVFTPNKLVELQHIWWPVGVTTDVHLMYQAVLPFLAQLREYKPNMVIVHAECTGKFYDIARPLKEAGIKVGVALLADTPVSRIEPAIMDIDHVLIFSGDLGHFGGIAKMSLLTKVTDIRKLKKTMEIGWDGGINLDNAAKLALGGVDVLNTGGAIHRAKDPATTYEKMTSLVSHSQVE